MFTQKKRNESKITNIFSLGWGGGSQQNIHFSFIIILFWVFFLSFLKIKCTHRYYCLLIVDLKRKTKTTSHFSLENSARPCSTPLQNFLWLCWWQPTAHQSVSGPMSHPISCYVLSQVYSTNLGRHWQAYYFYYLRTLFTSLGAGIFTLCQFY